MGVWAATTGSRNNQKFWLIGLLALAGFSQAGFGSSGSLPITVMTYNVENLFDDTHDVGKEDYTYLPLTEKRQNPEVRSYCQKQQGYRRTECERIDWTAQSLDTKLQKIQRVVSSFQNGRGPDVLILQEVENQNVLNRLVNKHLGHLGYRTIELVDGPDVRGIDVAVVSRLPLAAPSLYHSVDLSGLNSRATRGILETILQLPSGQPLVVFAVHWPSKASPDTFRARAAQAVVRASNRHPPNTAMIVAGDFNTAVGDQLDGVRDILTSEEQGGQFVDLAKEACQNHKACYPQTEYYPKTDEWSYFIRILVSKAIRPLTGFQNYQVHRPDFLMERSQNQMIPWRYDFFKGEGFSDHLPITLSFDK